MIGSVLLKPQRRSERSYVLTVSAAHALIHATELTYAALLLRIEAEFGSGLFLLGILANVSALALGLMALPAGFLTDRVGSVPVLRLTLAGSAVAAVMVALSVNEVMLGISLALLGVTTGLYHPPAVALLARTRRPSRNFGVHGAVGNLGIAAAPAVAAGLAVATDWRAAYVLLAGLAVVGFLAMARLDPRGPVAAVQPATPAASEGAPSGETDRGRGGGWRWGPIAMVYVLFIIAGFLYRGALTFIPTHIEEQIRFTLFGWDAAAVAGALAALALLAGAVGWYGGGLAAERLPRERLVLVISLLQIPVLMLISLSDGVGLLLAIALFALLNFALAPAVVTLVVDHSPRSRLGSSYGLTFFLSFGLGSFAGTATGFTADQGGTEVVFVMLAGVAGVGALAAGVLAMLVQRRGGPVASRPA